MARPLPGNHSASSATLEILSFCRPRDTQFLKWFLLQHCLHVSRQNGNKAISDYVVSGWRSVRRSTTTRGDGPLGLAGI